LATAADELLRAAQHINQQCLVKLTAAAAAAAAVPPASPAAVVGTLPACHHGCDLTLLVSCTENTKIPAAGEPPRVLQFFEKAPFEMSTQARAEQLFETAQRIFDRYSTKRAG
jgi:hypothetical protein